MSQIRKEEISFSLCVCASFFLFLFSEGLFFFPNWVVGQLICICTLLYRYLNSEDYEGGLEKSQIDEILSNIECNFHSWAVSFAAVAVGAQDPASVEKFSQSLQKMGPDVALALAKTVFWSDYRDVLDKVEVPCTIIQPTKDLVAPMSVAYYMEKKIKGKASVEVIEVDGHFPHLTCPQLLIATLDKILGSDSGEKKASGCEEEEKVSV